MPIRAAKGDSTPTSAGPFFEEARHETVRYHENLYASTELGDPDTWLANPHRLLLDALQRLPTDRPVIAYDLGAGIGRHTLPLLERLPPQSEVHAVDLLASALRQLQDTVPPGMPAELCVHPADLADFEFTGPADLVLAFSAIEHLPDVSSMRALLQRGKNALRARGVVALGMVADRVEIRRDGSVRPALLESRLSVQAAGGLITELFSDDFDSPPVREEPTEVDEERAGEQYTLRSTLVTWVGSRRAT